MSMSQETTIAVVAIGLIGLYIFTRQKDEDKKEKISVVPVEYTSLKANVKKVDREYQRMAERGDVSMTDLTDWLDQLAAIRKKLRDTQVFDKLRKQGITVSMDEGRFDSTIAELEKRIRANITSLETEQRTTEDQVMSQFREWAPMPDNRFPTSDHKPTHTFSMPTVMPTFRTDTSLVGDAAPIRPLRGASMPVLGNPKRFTDGILGNRDRIRRPLASLHHTSIVRVIPDEPRATPSPTFDSSPDPGEVLEGAGNIKDLRPSGPTENEKQGGFLAVSDENNALSQDGPSATEIARDQHKKPSRTVSSVSSVEAIENLPPPQPPRPNRPPTALSRVTEDLTGRNLAIHRLKKSSKILNANAKLRKKRQDRQDRVADFESGKRSAEERSPDDIFGEVNESSSKKKEDYIAIEVPLDDNVTAPPGQQSTNIPQPVRRAPVENNAMDGPRVPVQVGNVSGRHREGSPFQQQLEANVEVIQLEGVRDAFNAAPGSAPIQLQSDPMPEGVDYGEVDSQTMQEFDDFSANMIELERLVTSLEKEERMWIVSQERGRATSFRARSRKNKKLKQDIQQYLLESDELNTKLGQQSLGTDERFQTKGLRASTVYKLKQRFKKAAAGLTKKITNFDRKTKLAPGMRRVTSSNRSPRRGPPPLPGGLLNTGILGSGAIPVNPNSKQPAKRNRRKDSYVHVLTADQLAQRE